MSHASQTAAEAGTDSVNDVGAGAPFVAAIRAGLTGVVRVETRDVPVLCPPSPVS